MPLTLKKMLGALAAGLLIALSLATTAATANAQSSGFKPAIGVFNPIRTYVSGLCLQPAGGSTAHFATVVQEPCDGSAAQGWEPLSPSNNHYTFVNQVSGLCLWDWDGAADTASHTGRVLMDDCNGSSNAEFNAGQHLPGVVPLESRLHFKDSGTCIDVPGGSAAIGLAVQMYPCNGTGAQLWVI